MSTSNFVKLCALAGAAVLNLSLATGLHAVAHRQQAHAALASATPAAATLVAAAAPGRP